MSTIEKMEIQAIRSFGPDTVDAQRIAFFKPLTLILGPNGTGKTTIIECLRYAATGDFPPGGNKNGAFVHDPKLAREREIKGQVKLALKDVTGVTCTVIRSLVAKLKDAKGEKIETKTMDGVMSRLMSNGEKRAVTTRCVDLNREMITALGVSKAVLDNVIFCHQEESNWPLGEGKALKQKFDSIFDATRYTKVLEELKKIQQSQVVDIRVGKEELKYLKEKKDKAHDLQVELEELQDKLTSSEARVEDVNEKLEPIRTRLEQIGKNSHDIFKLQTLKQKCQTEKEQIEMAMTQLKKNISSPYTGSINQLKRELNEFMAGVGDKEEQIRLCERQLAGYVTESEKAGKEKSRLLLEVGKLQQEAETHDKNVHKRNEKIKELADEYNFEGFASAIDDDSCKRFFALMKEKLTECIEETKLKKREFEEEEREFQSKIDRLREDKTKLEHSEKMKRETMEKNKKDIQEIKMKLKHMASSEEKLDRIKTQLKRVENELSESEKTMDCNEIKAEIERLGRKRKQLDSDISNLNSEMNRLHKQSEAQTQLNMLTTDQEEKMRAINRLQSIHEDNIVGLLGHMPVDDLRLSIETFKSNQANSVSKTNTDLVSLKTNLSSKEAEKIAASNQLRQKERELKEKEDKIYSVCENQDFEEELSEVQKNLTQAQEEKGSLLGADHMIKKYIRGLEKNNPNCPLCHRGFERAQEVRELILKLEETRRKVPHNMRKAEEDMEGLQKKYDELMQLKPVRENIAALKDQEIPTMKSKVKKLEEEIKKIKQSREDKEEELMAKESDLEIINGMHSDIVLMDRYKGEVKELERKIAAQSALLSGSGSDRSLKVVIAEKEIKQLELDNTNRTLDHKREEINEFQEHLQKLRTRVNTMRGEKLNIEGELQQKSQLENTKATLVSDNINYQRDIEDSRAQIQPLEGQINKAIKEKDSITVKKEEMAATAREQSTLIMNNGNVVKNVNNEIKSYQQSGRAERKDKCQDRQLELSKTEKCLEADKGKITKELDDLRKDIATQKIRQRELDDSLQLLNKEEEIKKLTVKVEDLDEKLVHFNVKNIEKERQKLMVEEEKLKLDLNRATGRQLGYKDEIRSKQKELKSDMYKDADRKYSDEVIKNKTMEIAGRDLNKYYRAMDQAIMRYHNAKMEEINRIILYLWRKTYQGNDIDTIEIRSEDGETESKGIKARRSYNYRVVMIKNNIAIDMRGRCSAGQKVLASLIIRLALAETFCVNCGVLALDEPTTNLDRENIESLALALVEIIKDRHTVRHFQLVVITHDADFVELLGRADYVDQFIEVSKSDEGLSRLTVKRVEELQTR